MHETRGYPVFVIIHSCECFCVTEYDVAISIAWRFDPVDVFRVVVNGSAGVRAIILANKQDGKQWSLQATYVERLNAKYDSASTLEHSFVVYTDLDSRTHFNGIDPRNWTFCTNTPQNDSTQIGVNRHVHFNDMACKRLGPLSETLLTLERLRRSEARRVAFLCCAARKFASLSPELVHRIFLEADCMLSKVRTTCENNYGSFA
jgi:hypothetical protein